LIRAVNILCIPTYLPTKFIPEKSKWQGRRKWTKWRTIFFLLICQNLLHEKCKYNKVEGKWTKEGRMWISKNKISKHLTHLTSINLTLPMNALPMNAHCKVKTCPTSMLSSKNWKSKTNHAILK
jgi:hypothetical protein